VLEECEKIVEVVSQRLDPRANIIWGTIVDPNIEGSVRVMLVVTGVKSKQILGARDIREEESSLKRELGIDFLD